MKNLIRRIFLAGVLLALVFGLDPNQAQASWQSEVRLYLPLIVKPSRGIFGRVTLNGAPAPGLPIDLILNDGHSYVNIETRTTDASGTVSFQNVPDLPTDLAYTVRFLNASNTPGLVDVWYTNNIHTYTQGSELEFGTFDIANVQLNAPSNKATISLPYRFKWQPRPTSPGDLYVLEISGLPNYTPFWRTTSLGYVDSYLLKNLPHEFVSGMDCEWLIGIIDPASGSGVGGKGMFRLAANAASQAGSAGELILQPDLWELNPVR